MSSNGRLDVVTEIESFVYTTLYVLTILDHFNDLNLYKFVSYNRLVTIIRSYTNFNHKHYHKIRFHYQNENPLNNSSLDIT